VQHDTFAFYATDVTECEPDRTSHAALEDSRLIRDLFRDLFRNILRKKPSKGNFAPWTHVRNPVPLNQGVGADNDNPKDNATVKALRAAWLQKKAEIFAGKLTKPDSEDPDTVNHLNWYMATGFKRPYPGEKTVRPPSDFNNPAPAGDTDGDE
jgi:hypothetical protein